MTAEDTWKALLEPAMKSCDNCLNGTRKSINVIRCEFFKECANWHNDFDNKKRLWKWDGTK